MTQTPPDEQEPLFEEEPPAHRRQAIPVVPSQRDAEGQLPDVRDAATAGSIQVKHIRYDVPVCTKLIMQTLSRGPATANEIALTAITAQHVRVILKVLKIEGKVEIIGKIRETPLGQLSNIYALVKVSKPMEPHNLCSAKHT